MKKLLLLSLACLYACDGELKRQVEIKTAEVIGNLATRQSDEDVAGGFHTIPIALNVIDKGIYQATGVANTHMITTSSGNVVYDTGLSIQAANQRKILREQSENDITYIIVSHAHADHSGGAKFWKEPNSKIITHQEFVENQRYLTQLQDYFWKRNRILFPWIPEKPIKNSLLGYGGIEPDIIIKDDYVFQLGDETFEVLATPGAEGSDNIVLWLPKRKILFSGDFFGPLFPQFPNVFTMRGEKVRAPYDYIQSLNRVIMLEPELIVPSHHKPISGRENLRAAMTLIRDSVQYVHDATIDGMNAGKSLNELMKEIELPEHLQISQEHGKVSWAVKSIWEYYATWFHFESFTELYPIPASSVYSDLVKMLNRPELLQKAKQYIEDGAYIKAIHIIDVAESERVNQETIALRKQTYELLLERAIEESNNYEKDYLRYLISNLL